MKKSYIRKQKKPIDKVMAAIALYKHFSDEYPPTEEISEVCKYQKLLLTEEVRSTLLAEFPGVELP